MSNCPYLSPEQIRYDSSIDPDNMSQYTPKDYKAKTVYQKIPNSDAADTETSEDSRHPLPKYIEAIQNQEDVEPLPPYQELDIEGGANPKRVSCKKHRKALKIAGCVALLMFVLCGIQLLFNPVGCGSFDRNRSAAEENTYKQPVSDETAPPRGMMASGEMMMSQDEMNEMMDGY